MTIVNPLASANLVVQTSLSSSRPEERPLNLRMEQIVRATVVEGGLDKATLEFNQQRFQMATDKELQTGQQLELQVLATHPKLTFKILTPSFEARLARFLPLLDKPFDWYALLQKLSQTGAPQEAPLRETLDQLGSLLRPPADLPAEKLTELMAALGQLRRTKPLFAVRNATQLAAAFDRLLQGLARQIDGLELPQQLKIMARQIRQQPELMQNFVSFERGKIEQLLEQFDPPREQLSPRQARQMAVELRDLLTRQPENLPQKLNLLGQELGRLLTQTAGKPLELTPALLGQLKDLSGQLRVAATQKSDWPPELQQVVTRVVQNLQPLFAAPPIFDQGEKLGLLARLLGLNLETELLRGRSREALSSLKLALLTERENLDPEGREALQRLELFQVSRARLAEQNQLFFPLPLPGLEEGFLLADEEERAEGEAETPVRKLALHVRLSALGNMRIDILNEPSGLLLRIACEDQQRADFLQTLSAQLQERLQSVKLKGVSFTVGAESPARELIKKLLPEARTMFDARV